MISLCDSLRRWHIPADIIANALMTKFTAAMETAAKKNYVSELTSDEACAICMFAEIPYELDNLTGRITFRKCGLYKRDGKWVAVSGDNL